jgi:hypothetical protein
LTTAVAANVVLFTASMTILTDVGRFTVWAIHLSIMQRHALFQQNQNSDEFLSWTSGFKLKVETSIHSWIDQAGGEAGKLLRSLQKKSHQWWYFLEHPEIPPDNNLAERTLRLVYKKKS